MFRVRLATKEYCVALPPNGDATARYVKQFLVDNDEDLQVSPTQLRLMVKGKILADGDIVDASQTVAAPALVHILPSQHEIEAMHAREAEAKRIHDIRMTRHVVNIQARNEELTSRAHASTTYKFHAIETLPNMPNEATARHILESLATDPGILAVLAQHKWHVGALVEMFPDGKVGVDPVCVLGLNENKGQRIRLRLRTDDLLGFRKFLTIKQVLFHELSHNDVSDHNHEFYQLMRQVEAECNAVPMTRTTPLVRSVVQQQSSVGHRLGLGPSPPLPSSGNLPQPPNTLPSAAPRPELQTPPHSHARPSQQPGVEKAPSSPEAALPRAVLDDASQPKDGSARRDHIADARSTTPKAPSTPLPLAVAPLAEWDDMAVAMGGERVQQVHTAIHQLRTALLATASAPQTVATMQTLLANILSHPSDAKYKSFRKDNPRIARTIGSVAAAHDFLQSVGFEQDATHWTLQRHDPGLLWLGKTALETLVIASDGSN